jgi:hypothetical protein
MLKFSFEYRKLGDFTYNVLSDPGEIKSYLLKWIMSEWELDHREAPEEHWTDAWMEALPEMEFTLQVIRLVDICPNADLWSLTQFQTGLQKRAEERELSMLRGVSIEPLLVNCSGFELMDGYTRYTVLQRYRQNEVYAYVGDRKRTDSQ